MADRSNFKFAWLVAATRRSRLLRIAPWIVAADLARVAATVGVLVMGAVDSAGAAVLGALAVPADRRVRRDCCPR